MIPILAFSEQSPTFVFPLLDGLCSRVGASFIHLFLGLAQRRPYVEPGTVSILAFSEMIPTFFFPFLDGLCSRVGTDLEFR